MNFLKKIFGGKSSPGTPEGIAEQTLEDVFKIGDFDLSAKVRGDGEKIVVEVEGGDSELLKERDGQLLDALQFFIKRVVQHQLPESRVDVEFDTGGFREESNQALVDLAEKLKEVALEKGKPVYIRALAPKDRKIVHQYLADDERVRSKSIGDGHYKKIKIFPNNGNSRRDSRDAHDTTEEAGPQAEN
jgi:spoIIIJ-associated protein